MVGARSVGRRYSWSALLMVRAARYNGPVRRVLRQAWWTFRVHEGSLMSGAVAFHAMLALAPFGVIAVSVVSLLLGHDTARSELAAQLRPYLGEDTAQFLTSVADRAARHESGWLPTVASVLFLLFASTRLFWMLRAALNYTWGIRSRHPPGFRGLAWRVLRRRLIAFGMVFVFGGALVVAAVAKAGLAFAAALLGGVPVLYQLLDFVASAAVLTVLIALIFRWLPDARIAWRDCFVGASVTSVLATGGAFLVGQYVARVSPASMYGAAGSLVVLLLWVYYTSQMFFFGAALTHAWARLEGDDVVPLGHATRIVATDRHPIFEGFDSRLSPLGADEADAAEDPGRAPDPAEISGRG